MALRIEPIGVIHTGHRDPATTPVQAAANPAEEGVAVVDERYAAGLEGLAGFSHVWLLTWLGTDPPEPAALQQRPFARPDGPPVGIFAMRGPRRPVPVGLSLVEVVAVEASTLRFRGVDVVDGTPLLDLKPYFADADQPRGDVRHGWADELGAPRGPGPTGGAPPG